MASTIAPGWILRTLTFAERRQSAKTKAGANSDLLTPLQTSRLPLYRHWFTRGGADADEWPRFLEENLMSEADLLKIKESRRQFILPKWTATLAGLIGELRSRKTPFSPGGTAVENTVLPITQYAWSHLRDTDHVNVDSYLSPKAISALQQALIARLARLTTSLVQDVTPSVSVNGVSVQAINSVRSKVSTPTSCEPIALQVLQTYPALGRLWAVNVENWARSIRAFVTHAKMFSQSQGISKGGSYIIDGIDPDLSDFHHEGRTVMRVRFANGKDWFYKPRSATLESQWFAILQWLNRAGFGTPFRVLKVICRKDHSWMEAVEPHQCDSRKDVARYYYRAGTMLYLLHLLRGVDAHAGNIIAAGADPILVDCESLLHPSIRISKEKTKAEEGSLLRVGMLPMGHGGAGSQDPSALGRQVLGNHSVRLNGQQMQAADFVDSIIAGFCEMHAFIRPRVARFQKAMVRSGNSRCRYIYRPTMSYASILNQSLSPALLRDGFDRSLFLLAFCRDGLIPTRLVQSELAALERGDIPIAYGRTCRPLQPPPETIIKEMLAQIRRAFATSNQV